jgi:hypothetical protein
MSASSSLPSIILDSMSINTVFPVNRFNRLDQIRMLLKETIVVSIPQGRQMSEDTIATSYPSAAPPSPLTKQEKVGFIFITLAVVIVCLGCYFCYTVWQHRREREEINYVNTRVDSVLGDMALVPTDFYDDDDDQERSETEMI